MKVVETFSWANFALCSCSLFCISITTLAFILTLPPLSFDPTYAKTTQREKSVTILFLVVLNITIGASARGYKEVWNGSISDLGWYGEEAGQQGGNGVYQGVPQQYGVGQQGQSGVSYTYPNVQTFGGSQPVYQLPGHSVVITNGPNGQSSKFNAGCKSDVSFADFSSTLIVQQVPVVPQSESGRHM